MRLVDYLDKGASLGADAPCLTTDGESRTYGEVQDTSRRVAIALARRGVRPGDKVAILSANDPTAFTCVFGISRAGRGVVPGQPSQRGRREPRAPRPLRLLACSSSPARSHPLVDKIRGDLPAIHTLVCLDDDLDWALTWDDFLGADERLTEPQPVDDVAMIVGTGGTTGRPKGVMLTDTNLETMTALTLMGYPFDGRPVYLALAPLTHAAGVLCFPVLALGGEVVIMRTPDVGGFLDLVGRHSVTHTFLPPTLVYMVLGHPGVDTADLSSLQCFWYGAAPMSVARLTEALERGWPMAQLFGQTEAPMMISMMPPADHRRPDGSIATERLASAGRPAPLVRLAILDDARTRGRRAASAARSASAAPW